MQGFSPVRFWYDHYHDTLYSPFWLKAWLCWMFFSLALLAMKTVNFYVEPIESRTIKTKKVIEAFVLLGSDRDLLLKLFFYSTNPYSNTHTIINITKEIVSVLPKNEHKCERANEDEKGESFLLLKLVFSEVSTTKYKCAIC